MISLGLNNFLLSATFAVMSPYLQLFFRARGFSFLQTGLLLGTFGLAGVVGPILTGLLGDWLRSFRPLVFAAMAGAALAFVPLGWVGGFGVSLLLTLLFGSLYRATMPLTDAYLLHSLPDPLHQYGRVRVLGSLGFIVVGLILQHTGAIDGRSSRSILLCFVVLAALHLASVPLLPERRRAGPFLPRPAGRNGFEPGFWLGIGFAFLCQLGMAGHYSFFSLFLQEVYGLDRVGDYWVLGTIAEMPFIFWSGRLIRRWGIPPLLLVSGLSVALRLGVYALTPSLAVLLAAQVLHGLSYGVFQTALIALIGRAVHPSRRAAGVALFNAVGLNLASFAGGAAGGALLEAAGFRTLFLTLAAAPLLGLPLLLPLRAALRRPVEAAAGG